jgi:hypothetical protein
MTIEFDEHMGQFYCTRCGDWVENSATEHTEEGCKVTRQPRFASPTPAIDAMVSAELLKRRHQDAANAETERRAHEAYRQGWEARQPFIDDMAAINQELRSQLAQSDAELRLWRGSHPTIWQMIARIAELETKLKGDQ